MSPKHLHRDVVEVVFKRNTRNMEDGQRIVAAISAAEGKHLPVQSKIAS